MSGLIKLWRSHKSCADISFVLSGRGPHGTRGSPTSATLQAPFCGIILFFSHRTTRFPVIPNKRHGQGLPWFYHCHYHVWSSLGYASSLPLSGMIITHVLGLAIIATKPLMDPPRVLPSRLKRNTIRVKLFRVPTFFCVMPKTSRSHDRSPVGIS